MPVKSSFVSNRHTSPSISPGEFDVLARDLRKKLETVWCYDTAHRSIQQLCDPGLSAGQCYVSSMAFACLLEERFYGLVGRICRGVVLLDGRIAIDDHGWVQVSIAGRDYIIDLTIDQGIPELYVLTTYADSAKAEFGIEHRLLTSKSLLEVENEDAYIRYLILEARLIDAFGNFASWELLDA